MGDALVRVILLGLDENVPHCSRDTGLTHVVVVEDEDVPSGLFWFCSDLYLFCFCIWGRY